ncbi:MAG: NADH-ubiquinone oxidoreductase subunit NDUFA12 family protein [Bdellovibrionales bacterium]|jgi:NADH:ubiquinone oxidoreductase subunit
MNEAFSWIRQLAQIGTKLTVVLFGRLAFTDAYDNRYYVVQKPRWRSKATEKRWVLYAGAPEATKVPPEAFVWLHHLCDQPLPKVGRTRYGKDVEHHPNLTGTVVASFPSGYGLSLKKGTLPRHRDNQAWQPPA